MVWLKDVVRVKLMTTYQYLAAKAEADTLTLEDSIKELCICPSLLIVDFYNYNVFYDLLIALIELINGT